MHFHENKYVNYILHVLTHPPAVCGFGLRSSHLEHSSKTPPLSLGSTLSSSQTHILLHKTAAALLLIPAAAFEDMALALTTTATDSCKSV